MFASSNSVYCHSLKSFEWRWSVIRTLDLCRSEFIESGKCSRLWNSRPAIDLWRTMIAEENE